MEGIAACRSFGLAAVKLRPGFGQLGQPRVVPHHDIGVTGIASHEVLMFGFGGVEFTAFQLGCDRLVARRLRCPVGDNYDGRLLAAPVGEFWLPFAVAGSNRRARRTTLVIVADAGRKRGFEAHGMVGM